MGRQTFDTMPNLAMEQTVSTEFLLYFHELKAATTRISLIYVTV